MNRIHTACAGLSAMFLLHALGCGHQELRVPDSSSAGSAGNSLAAAGDASDASNSSDAGSSSDVAPSFERPTALGAACVDSADCSATPGLLCLGPDRDVALELGAPPGGLCTARCASDTDCQRYRPGAVCGSFAEMPLDGRFETASPTTRFCMEPCTLGAPGGPSKCHGRPGMACRPVTPPHVARCAEGDASCGEGQYCFRGFCRELACGARCNVDADCAKGRRCDVKSGLCVDHEVSGVDLGAVCDADVPSAVCKDGSCLVMFDDDGTKTGAFCTMSCVIGEDCAGGRGVCHLPRFPDYVAGDIGYCQPKCSCDDDCHVPGDRCVPWSSEKLEQHYGSKGVCQNVADPDFSPLSCAGGAGNDGS